MRNIKLNDSECMFIYYTLRKYANQTENLDDDDKEDIHEVANKFK
jgi:hypothetical protein